MPLQKQVIPLPATGGIDQGTADQLRDPQSLKRGDNVEQLKTGEIVKRKGFEARAANIVGDFWTHGKDDSKFFQLSDDTVGVLTTNSIVSGNNIPSWLGDQGQSFSPLFGYGKTSKVEITAFNDSVYADAAKWSAADFTFIATYSKNAHIYIYRTDANNTLVPYNDYNFVALNTTSYTRPRVTPSHTFTTDVSSGKLRRLAHGSTAGSLQDLNALYSFPATGGSNKWDATQTPDGTQAWAADDGAQITIMLRNSGNTLIGTTTVSNTNVKEIAWVVNRDNNAHVYLLVTRNGGSNSELYRISTATALVTTTRTIASTQTIQMMSGIEENSTLHIGINAASDANDITTYYYDEYTNSENFTGGTTVVCSTGVNDQVLRQACMASRPFVLDNMPSGIRYFIFMSYTSNGTSGVQNSIFLCARATTGGGEKTFRIAEKTISGTAIMGPPRISNVLNTGSVFDANLSNVDFEIPGIADWSTYGIMPLLSRKPNASGLIDASEFAVDYYDVRIQSAPDVSKVVIKNDEYIFGYNSVMHWSQNQFHEYGWHIYPEKIDITETVRGVTAIPGGATYGVACYYEYELPDGTAYRSAPIFGEFITGGSSDYRLNYTANNAPFCTKRKYRVQYFRTTGGGSIYYSVGSKEYELIDGSIPNLAFSEEFTDAELELRSVLYTTGGVVENVNSAVVEFVSEARNRLWSCERGSEIDLWYTKAGRFGGESSFSDSLKLRVDPDGGLIRYVAPMDEKIIIFKDSAIYVLTGDGPSETLVGSFSTPAKISNGIGCANKASIVETPIGIFFESSEGIYLLDRSLQTAFIGRPIYEQGAITRSLYKPDTNSVYFATATEIWVYYITTGAWYKWTLSGVKDFWIDNGTLYASVGTNILKQGSGYQDAGSNYSQALRFGQYAFSGVQGYQRIYRLLFTGPQTSSTTTLTVKNYFDYNTTETDTLTITAANSKSGNRMAIEVRPSVQKCESMETEIIHTGNDEGIKINAVTAEVGVIGGAGRRAATGRVT